MVDKNRVCNDLEVMANGLYEASKQKDHATVASVVFVRTLEEYKEFLSDDTYQKLRCHHNNIMSLQKLKYEDVLFKLSGEGYHFPPYK